MIIWATCVIFSAELLWRHRKGGDEGCNCAALLSLRDLLLTGGPVLLLPSTCSGWPTGCWIRFRRSAWCWPPAAQGRLCRVRPALPGRWPARHRGRAARPAAHRQLLALLRTARSMPPSCRAAPTCCAAATRTARPTGCSAWARCSAAGLNGSSTARTAPAPGSAASGWRACRRSPNGGSTSARRAAASHLMHRLLIANGLEPAKLPLSRLPTTPAVMALLDGRLDALALVSAPESPIVRMLLITPGIRLFDFAQAEAYARRVPQVAPVLLPRGVVDLAPGPARTGCAAGGGHRFAAGARDTHPALQRLLVQAARRIHSGPTGSRTRANIRRRRPATTRSRRSLSFYASRRAAAAAPSALRLCQPDRPDVGGAAVDRGGADPAVAGGAAAVQLPGALAHLPAGTACCARSSSSMPAAGRSPRCAPVGSARCAHRAPAGAAELCRRALLAAQPHRDGAAALDSPASPASISPATLTILPGHRRALALPDSRPPGLAAPGRWCCHDLAAPVLVPSSDPHLSEYLPERWQGRFHFSGFTGSMEHAGGHPRPCRGLRRQPLLDPGRAELAGTTVELVKIPTSAATRPIDWLTATLARPDAGGLTRQCWAWRRRRCSPARCSATASACAPTST